MNTPAEILQIWIGNGVKKANLPVFKMILLGMAAGVYIGFGAHVFLLATAAASFSSETCSPSRSEISSEAR
jgi:formate/nitrite transporter FocA (FNT family)